MFQIYMVGVLNDSRVIRTNIQTKRKHDSLVLNSWSFTIMASVAGTKRKDDLLVLKERFADQIDTDITTDDYVDFDIEVTTSHGRLTTADIIAEVTGTQQQNEAGEENNDEENEDTVTKPTNTEVRRAISVLEDFSLFSNFGEAMMKSL